MFKELERFSAQDIQSHIKEQIEQSQDHFNIQTSKIEYSISSGQFFAVDSDAEFVKIKVENLIGSHKYFQEGDSCQNDLYLEKINVYNLEVKKDEER